MYWVNRFVVVMVLASMAGAADVEPMAQGDWPHVEAFRSEITGKHEAVAIRSEEELARVFGPQGQAIVSQALGVSNVDIEKQMVLAVGAAMLPRVGVSGGGEPSAMHRVAILGLEKQGETMTVSWGLVPRRAGDPILGDSVALALAERAEGKVEFKQMPRQDKPVDLKKPAGVLAEGFWPDGWRRGVPAQGWVVRSYHELVNPRIEAPEAVLEQMRRANLRRYTKALGVDAIHFEKQMVVGVSGGTQGTDGYRVEIASMKSDPGRRTLTIHWKLAPPAKDKLPQRKLTNPAEVVLINAFEGEVVFDPPVEQRKPWHIALGGGGGER